MTGEIDKVRQVQQMLKGSEAGNTLLTGLCNVGHIGSVLNDDQERIEYNLVLRILQASGLIIEFKAADLPEDPKETDDG